MARGFNYAPVNSPEVEEASQPGLSKARIDELAYSRNAVVREAIARRDDCPLGLMTGLVHDHQASVRAALAGNPKVLRSVLDHLSRDKHAEVLVAIAGNPSAPQETVEGLASHRKREVREAAEVALEARRLAGPVEDTHTPELRDRVFEEAAALRARVLAESAVEHALEGAVHAVAANPPAPLPGAAVPVREAAHRPSIEA